LLEATQERQVASGQGPPEGWRRCGRFSVAVDDVKKAAIPVLRRRVNTNFQAQAQAEGKTSEDVINQLLTVVGEGDVGKYEKRKR